MHKLYSTQTPHVTSQFHPININGKSQKTLKQGNQREYSFKIDVTNVTYLQ